MDHGEFKPEFPEQDQQSENIRIVTWNVLTEEYYPEGMEVDHMKRRKIQMDYLESLNSDIIMLQEVDDLFLHDLKNHSLSITHRITQTDAVNPYGQLTLVKTCHNFVWFSHSFGSKKSHKKIVTIFLHGIYFVNCHLTAGGGENVNQRKKQLEAIAEKFSKGKCIVVGDTNMWNGELHPLEWVDLCPKKWWDVPTHSAKNNTLTIDVFDESRFDRYYSNFPVMVNMFHVDQKEIGSDHYCCILGLDVRNIEKVDYDYKEDPVGIIKKIEKSDPKNETTRTNSKKQRKVKVNDDCATSVSFP